MPLSQHVLTRMLTAVALFSGTIAVDRVVVAAPPEKAAPPIRVARPAR